MSLRQGIRRRPRAVQLALAIALLITAITALVIGAVRVPAPQVIDTLAGALGIPGTGHLSSAMQESILLSIRVPRVILGVLAGSVLAITGVLMQAFFRNPLADPALIGVSAGGALGAIAMIVFGVTFFSGFTVSASAFALPAAAFFGSLLTTVMVFSLARRDGQVDATTMLLCGIAVNAMAGACIGLMSFVADDAQLRDLTFWSLGSLGAASWWQVKAVGLVFLIIALSAALLAAPLNALLLGDGEALHLGYHVEKLKLGILVITCLGAGAVVATCGVIAFVGLIAPHLSRLMLGPDHRHVLPLSGMVGAVLLCLADIVARTSVSPAELPIGVLTALIGGPVFIWLLRQK